MPIRKNKRTPSNAAARKADTTALRVSAAPLGARAQRRADERAERRQPSAPE